MSKQPSKPTDILENPAEQSLLNETGHNELIAQLNSAEQKNAEYWERILRMQADAENLARRTERDISNAHKFALERFLSDLLPVIDNLERAIVAAQEHAVSKDHSIIDGVALTLQMLHEVLSKSGVQVINPVKEQFNPDFHEAVSLQKDAEFAAGSVITVLQKGYTLNARLIRAAMVIVAQ
jgi:molecular chaperone GrpE